MSWSYQSYWEKAKQYCARASAEGRDKPLYAFWSSLTLEFLARATLANVHPAFLADPKDNGLYNLLYAFELSKDPKKSPRSIGAKAVFERCSIIHPSKFTKEDVEFSAAMAEQRNSELHSGEKAFEKWPNQIWLAKYYRVCSIHLSIQGKGLSDLFDKDEAEGAQKMIDGMEEKWKTEAQKAIAKAKAYFETLPEQEREELRSIQTVDFHRWLDFVWCPACGISAMLWGEPVHFSEARLENDMITWDVSVLPTNFECTSCKLKLAGYGLLYAAGLGGQFSIKQKEDPVAYYSPEEDRSEPPEYD